MEVLPGSPELVDPPARPYEVFFHMMFRDREAGDFPLRLSVELTDHCNLGCPLCPRQDTGRTPGFLDSALFESIAAQAAGRDVIFYPQGLGESLLHPRYFELLGRLRALGVRYPVVITNATLLDQAACEQLVDAAPLCVVLSLDGADPELFEELRPGANYAEVVENCKRLLATREQRGADRPRIVLSVVGARGVAATLDRFRAEWQPRLRPTDEIFVCAPVTWAGAIAYGGEPGTDRPHVDGPRPPCRMLYKTLTVYQTGSATPCCYDHRCELEVGNVRERSVEQIWKGEELARLRRLHEAGRADEIPLCRDCPDWIP